MILESLYGFFKNVVCFFLGLLPGVDTSFMETWSYIKEILMDIVTGIGCLIPMASLFPLFYAQLSLWAFRLAWSVILRLKSFIPFISG